ncbi:Transcriptional regulator WAR1 [Madurella mycetomatis]|uniref:Transcriptional regulator WAR1 n=1 Tax=Madurella mycetomatis TaxID=100816 RepID=A0A175VQ68_9PEZI|nr:Transcriptional regulator WAR1 [Madurella mycetomatis]
MEPNTSAISGNPAPYGRACTNCARAKCRCIYRSDGADCERCHRLGKECVPSVSVRKRNGKRAHVSRAAQLEAKLEDLVTLLRHQAGPADKPSPPVGTAGNVSVGTPATNAPSNVSHTAESSPRSATCLPAAIPRQQPNCTVSKPQPVAIFRGPFVGGIFESPTTAQPTPPPPLESASMPSCVYQPTALEAEENLTTFRKYLLIFFPFIHLPEATTSKRLREIYPFLWFNIMTVTCKNADRRIVMSDAARKFMAQKMVVEHEKSLDLLLGLLVIMGWTHYHLKKEKPILSVLASLAKSLVYDLGLNKVPGEPDIAACLKTSFHPPPREKTIEEKRAVLACFYLTSQIAHSLKRLDALIWTPHMDEFLQSLSQKKEWEGDDLLVAQVRIQLTLEQLTRATSQSPDPPGYYLSALQVQLQNIKTQLPHHLQQNDIVLSHISYTELVIHEAGLAKPKSPASGTIPDLQRYEAMEGCLSAVRDWFDRHFSIPSYVYVGLTFGYWCHMAHCMLALYRISVLDDPAWDRRAVRNKIDLLGVCDRLKTGFEQVAAQRLLDGGLTVEEDGFSKFNRMLRTIKSSWAAELAAIDGSAAQSSNPPVEPFLDGLNVPLFQPDDSEAWIAGLFDINWEA